jgi:signal transduction histidine kinase
MLSRPSRRLAGAALGGLALLVALDVLVGLQDRPGAADRGAAFLGGTVGPLAVPAALGVYLAGVLLLSGSVDRRRLTAAAALLGAVSLAASVLALALRSARGEFGLTELALLLGMLAGLARWVNGRLAVAVAVLDGLAVVALAARTLVPLGSPGGLALGCLLWTVAAVGAVALGGFLRTLDVRQVRVAAEVRRAERVELARELHDFVAHHVSGMVVQAQAARVVAGTDPARATAALATIERAGVQALAAMRRTVRALRELAAPETTGGPPGHRLDDLDGLVAGYLAAGGADVRLDADAGLAADVPAELATTVYRIVLEGLTNVRRHAPTASSVDIAVHRVSYGQGVALSVSVTDNGPAPPGEPGPARGFGLIGLRERVALLDGVLTAGPVSPTGWRLAARLPLPETP